MIVLLFGPPGCGKGTQAAFIAKRFQIPAISTGEMFRSECKSGSCLGKTVSSIMAGGGLVGDNLVNRVVESRISKPDCAAGFLLDGYPRTVWQALFLDRLRRRKGHPKPVAIHLDVPAEVLVSRLSARRQCPQCSRIYNLISQPPGTYGVCDVDGAQLIQRQDDYEEVILQRLKAYEELTNPVITWYARHHRIDGTGSPAEISRQIEQVLETAAPLASWQTQSA